METAGKATWGKMFLTILERCVKRNSYRVTVGHGDGCADWILKVAHDEDVDLRVKKKIKVYHC